jgi:hypothetical protein
MKPQPQLAGVTLLVRSSLESCTFDWSVLNLASEGLLLGASLHTIVEGTSSNPRQSGSRIPNIYDCAKDIPVTFCREAMVPASSTQRLGRIDGMRVCTTERAGTRMRRFFWVFGSRARAACSSLSLARQRQCSNVIV